MGVFTVTQAQYKRVMKKNWSHFSKRGGGKEMVAGMDTSSFPVERVSWHDAAWFCRQLSGRAREGKAGRVYRLPTEAEWEYACRAGTSTAYHFGDTLDPDRANIRESGLGRPSLVGSYPPNAWGLYDMHGNVFEWCQDWNNEYTAAPVVDQKGPARGDWRIYRGGSWHNEARSSRSARRVWLAPEDPGYDCLGFRVACDITSTK
jgi:formylglycine-generating enzyme required for sulfatase activity